jgi:hypothetical protein
MSSPGTSAVQRQRHTEPQLAILSKAMTRVLPTLIGLRKNPLHRRSFSLRSLGSSVNQLTLATHWSLPWKVSLTGALYVSAFVRQMFQDYSYKPFNNSYRSW